MPDWSNQIPDDPRGQSLPIMRTPGHKPLEAIITSHDLIGCFTHFWKGSTHPCEGENCEACQDGTRYLWHAYTSAVDCFTNLHFIFECTAKSAEYLTAHRDKYASLRGCLFKAVRWHNRPNGRILIQTKMADLAERQLPDPPDLKKCMAIIWNIPTDDVQTPTYDQQTKMKTIAATKKPGQKE